MIEKSNFRKWLVEQSQGERVFHAVPHVVKGYMSWSCGCPLATYCHEQLNRPMIAWAGDGGTDFAKPGGEGQSERMAGTWAISFVNRVDTASSVSHGVAASLALSILDEIAS